MHYHKSLDTRQPALIVDIGGGTTDVTFAQLGGNEHPHIVRNWGLPKGGTDLDVALSLHSFMPWLGKDTIRVPQHQFVEAASVHNLPKQREFRKQNYRLIPEPYGSRLRALQEPGATTRLNQLAERTKIVLSHSTGHRAELDFIEPALVIETGREDFDAAIEAFLTQLERTLQTVRDDLTQMPDSVFLTGGTSRSVQIRERVKQSFPDMPLVLGDPSLGVVSGLAVAASEAENG
jgi:hypothetical chaperone protein